MEPDKIEMILDIMQKQLEIIELLVHPQILIPSTSGYMERDVKK